MKNCLKAVVAFMVFALVAGATDFPKYETYLGYDFTRFNPDSPAHVIPSFNANGGTGQFVYNFNKWFGLATDISAVTKGELNQASVDTTALTFTAGPRVSFRGHHFSHNLTPFVQSLFGGGYGTTSTQISAVNVVTPFDVGVLPNSPVTARLVASRTGFAMLAGGGVDWHVGKHFAFRPFEFDYLLTRMPNFVGEHVNRNNWRFTAGANFTFGKE
jgi:hypothetical protein